MITVTGTKTIINTAAAVFAGSSVLANRFRYINAFAATVQSAHETGNWTSYLWLNAYNGAGIKADARSNLIVKGMKK